MCERQQGVGGPETGGDPWRVAEVESALASGSGREALGTGVMSGGNGRQEKVAVAAAAVGHDELPSIAKGLHLYPELELQVEPESEAEESEASDPQVQRCVRVCGWGKSESM